LLVNVTETVALLVNVVDENVALFTPWLMLLTNQAYVGAAPPFTGVAVNVTFVPAQIVPVGFATTVTEGTAVGMTFIVMPLLVTVAWLGHAALLLICTVTTSLLARVVDMKVLAVCPA
jgi:hypothetical protein